MSHGKNKRKAAMARRKLRLVGCVQWQESRLCSNKCKLGSTLLVR